MTCLVLHKNLLKAFTGSDIQLPQVTYMCIVYFVACDFISEEYWR
jgi:hypothetical protein